MTRPRLTVEQWATIRDAFPVSTRTGGQPRDLREIVDGIFWFLNTGAPWRALPKEFGPWPTVWELFDKWTANGTLDRIISILRAERIDYGDLDHDLWRLDGTVIRAARCAAAGGKTTPRRTNRPRIWPLPWRIIDLVPYPLLWILSSVEFPFDSRTCS